MNCCVIVSYLLFFSSFISSFSSLCFWVAFSVLCYCCVLIVCAFVVVCCCVGERKGNASNASLCVRSKRNRAYRHHDRMWKPQEHVLDTCAPVHTETFWIYNVLNVLTKAFACNNITHAATTKTKTKATTKNNNYTTTHNITKQQEKSNTHTQQLRREGKRGERERNENKMERD